MIFVVVSTGHFDPLIKECDRLSDHYEFFGQIGMGTFVPRFPHFRNVPPQEIESKMREAELVISHGGTGMLSMLYRLQKPTIICPKQMRYGEANDSQVELAVRWAKLGMGILCMDVKDIESAIIECRDKSFHFPSFPSLGKFLARG